MKIFIGIITSLILISPALAQSKRRGGKKKEVPTPAPTPTPGFSIDPTLKDKVFEESLTTQPVNDQREKIGFVEVGLGFLHPLSFATENSYYKVDYGKSFSWLPTLSVAFDKPFLTSETLTYSVRPQFGFFYTYKGTEVESTIVDIKARDDVSVTGLPLGVGIAVAYEREGLIPTAEFGLQYLWLQQSGYLDGLSQSFWLPGAFLAIGATLDESPDKLIGGYNANAFYQVNRQNNSFQHSIGLRVGVTLNVFQ